VSKKGYNGDSVRGPAVSSQEVWPLSVAEASQLKASVRSYGDSWWLRTPGRSAKIAAYVNANGTVNVYGRSVFEEREGVFLRYSIRPALYISLSEIEMVSPDIGAAIASGTADVGAYDRTLRVTDAKGHTWDVVGVNGRTVSGLSAPKGYAALLLSSSSEKKFAFPKQRYSSTIYGTFNAKRPYTNDYSVSDLRRAMAAAYRAIKNLPGLKGKIAPRNLKGNATYNNKDSRIAGPTVKSQRLWPLTVNEAKKLTNQQRIFSDDWWVRSPGVTDYQGADIYNTGYVPGYGSIVANRNALRPAFYLKLSSSIFKQLPGDWQDRV
jgi:hypothetical protein